MATRLNVSYETFAQLVRFTLVGLFSAGIYSAIYWYLATYVMPPVVAVVFAFLVTVSIGFVLHSRWSFRGHGKREDRRTRIKFLAVQGSGFLLNELFTWAADRADARADLVAADPGDLRHPACDLYLQPAVGVRLMERLVYREMAELDERHWWYRARRAVLAELIRREAVPPANAHILEIGCGTGHNLGMLGQFGRVDAIELDDESRAIAEARLGGPVMNARCPSSRALPTGITTSSLRST